MCCEISGFPCGECEEYSLYDIVPCSLAEVYRRFGGAYCLRRQDSKTSETSICLNKATRRNVTKGCNLEINVMK
jgi:hypothetical protein